ncbi:CoB--CoM heterodisulfide reductase iron-sulfur subunit A family protein [Desulfosporosinus sp.]|uniref:CoB--CoM heterodisulfide reductase iron-sulfur subunit A family protein n=1 Tax=Desulfosporosinus sp. TaxID=157907 RepID=UPI000E807436|nr:CoB--CoM heterodisulfide reductase iron-sulfur subunit A family protein [Desulfosporosinus sp.]MBC2723149.1 CoB--CoM heterodisulfide reductase iron-sulfur subunit A family protein [Desulfosporosinus sp.]MBC2725861.1 CoB--CoM heterodisulfide reductase iron-sulfur subunit A family protein [Desulfosporosinus sp.]HBV89302.1 heterodisulfide reductase subunit A [Desulfosporosinus sp.]
MAHKSILVVGGGVSGLTAAVEASEAGSEVYLVEQKSYLGGRVAQMNQYFPKLCPPNCGLEINFKRIKQNPRIKFFTLAEIEKINGVEGDYTVTVKLNPRYVNQNCTACGKCSEVCPAERSNEFNYGMDKTKAAYKAHEFAFPMKYVIDGEACLGAECGKCVAACQYGAIELDMAAKSFDLNVGSIVWSTGWEPYDATKVDYYGFGKHQNVITNVMMERLAASNGPTAGKIVRPSDGKEVKTIAFVQCAGSRDENHLPYCSGVCCMASLKQATYVKAMYPDSKVYMFYIDVRAMGKHEEFYTKVQDDITMIKGKVGEISEDPETKDVIVQVENQLTGEIMKETVDMVVLATGMVPATSNVPDAIAYDEDGFVVSDPQQLGIYGAGCVKKPLDVSSSVKDSTSAALKAIQSTVRR